jgi:hypothetical protein
VPLVPKTEKDASPDPQHSLAFPCHASGQPVAAARCWNSGGCFLCPNSGRCPQVLACSTLALARLFEACARA